MKTILISLLIAAAGHGADLLEGVRNRSDWEKRRQQILANMQLVMGAMPKQKPGKPSMTVLEEQRFPEYVRKKITFISEPGDRGTCLSVPSQWPGPPFRDAMPASDH